MRGRRRGREREEEGGRKGGYIILLLGEVNSWPCARGGHQLCLDVNAQLIYLFGGWDGMQELSDFWVFNVNGKYWKCLSRDTTEQVTAALFPPPPPPPSSSPFPLYIIISPPFIGWSLCSLMSQNVSRLRESDHLRHWTISHSRHSYITLHHHRTCY